MNPTDLQEWIEACGFSRNEAARQLDISINRLRRMLDGEVRIPRHIALACWAIEWSIIRQAVGKDKQGSKPEHHASGEGDS